MTRGLIWRGTAALLALVVTALPAVAQFEAPSGPFSGFKSADEEPVYINAERFEGDLAARKLVWLEHVTAKQGKRTIYADRMDVIYEQDWKVKTLVARGNVKVHMEDTFATADKLIWDNTKKVIYLIGKPRVVQENQIILGRKMTYWIEKEKMRVEKPRIEWRQKKPEGKAEQPGTEEAVPAGEEKEQKGSKD
ncbi:MAG: LptA/OstA family protein [bacterium]